MWISRNLPSETTPPLALPRQALHQLWRQRFTAFTAALVNGLRIAALIHWHKTTHRPHLPHFAPLLRPTQRQLELTSVRQLKGSRPQCPMAACDQRAARSNVHRECRVATRILVDDICAIRVGGPRQCSVSVRKKQNVPCFHPDVLDLTASTGNHTHTGIKMIVRHVTHKKNEEQMLPCDHLW